MVENGEGLGTPMITTVTTTRIPCCGGIVSLDCRASAREVELVADDTMLSQLHVINIEFSNDGITGASLSEPNTSVTAFRTRVCMLEFTRFETVSRYVTICNPLSIIALPWVKYITPYNMVVA